MRREDGLSAVRRVDEVEESDGVRDDNDPKECDECSRNDVHNSTALRDDLEGVTMDGRTGAWSPRRRQRRVAESVAYKKTLSLRVAWTRAAFSGRVEGEGVESGTLW